MLTLVSKFKFLRTLFFSGLFISLVFNSSITQAALTSDKDLVSVGSSVSLSWSESSSCSAYDDWSGSKSQSGSESVTVSKVGWNIFSLNCNGSYENVYVYGTLFSTGLAATATKKSMFEKQMDVLKFYKPSDDISFSIVNSSGSMDDSLFSLSSSDALTFKSAPDYEDPKDVGTNNVYNLQIAATDGTNNETKDLEITIKNFNDAPSNITLSNTVVAENTIESTVGRLTAYDDDLLSTAKNSNSTLGERTVDTITFLISGTDAEYFEIPAAFVSSSPETVYGDLKFKRNLNNGSLVDLDYETKSTYLITVTVKDSGTSPNSSIRNPLSYSEDFTITLSNRDEPVTGVSLSTLEFNENLSASSQIATVSAITEDKSDSHTYTLSGTDASSFVLSGDQLLLSSSFSPDYETKTTYSITLTASDSANSSASNSFTLQVRDLPEYPYGTATNYKTISENGTTIMTLTATDNNNTVINFSLGTGQDAEYFSINGAGDLIFSRAPDYETPQDDDLDNVYEVPIVMTNGALNSYYTFYVTVSDVEEVGGIELASKVSTVKTQEEE
ncbi:MAG: hypothetical protein ACJ0GU_04340 [Gammaproteobacteria bacterium]